MEASTDRQRRIRTAAVIGIVAVALALIPAADARRLVTGISNPEFEQSGGDALLFSRIHDARPGSSTWRSSGTTSRRRASRRAGTRPIPPTPTEGGADPPRALARQRFARRPAGAAAAAAGGQPGRPDSRRVPPHAAVDHRVRVGLAATRSRRPAPAPRGPLDRGGDVPCLQGGGEPLLLVPAARRAAPQPELGADDPAGALPAPRDGARGPAEEDPDPALRFPFVALDRSRGFFYWGTDAEQQRRAGSARGVERQEMAPRRDRRGGRQRHLLRHPADALRRRRRRPRQGRLSLKANRCPSRFIT